MSDAIYYERPVLLDRDRHRRLRVKPSTAFGFARRANSLYLAGAEFGEAAKEYPIVFMRSGGGPVLPVAMLGLRTRDNLFVDDAGRWTARYIPAFVRRYPFVLANIGGNAMALAVDEAYAGLNEGEGEALFDAQGDNTPFLANAMDFLQRYQREFARTEAFCKRIADAGLLREMNAKADLKDGRSFTVSGLMVVDDQKLAALPDAQALAFFRSGELQLLALHLSSLSNMQGLVERMAQRSTPLPPAPKPV